MLRGAFAADAGALIELVYGTLAGEALREAMLGEDAYVVTHEVAVAELRYVLCRAIGREDSKARVGKLLVSGYLRVEGVAGLVEAAADYKCERAISLPDCFTLSLAKDRSLEALFASRERELTEEMEKRPFDVEIRFLEDHELDRSERRP